LTAAHSPQTLFIHAVKLIISQMTAIADFKQRWRQRGKKRQTAALISQRVKDADCCENSTKRKHLKNHVQLYSVQNWNTMHQHVFKS